VLAAFGQRRFGSRPVWLKQRRQAGPRARCRTWFSDGPHEEWRFTPITPLLHLPLHPANPPARPLAVGEIAPFTFGLEGCRWFCGRRFCAELSVLPAPGGDLQAVSLRAALAGGAPELERHLARVAGDETMVFTALNTAFFGRRTGLRGP